MTTSGRGWPTVTDALVREDSTRRPVSPIPSSMSTAWAAGALAAVCGVASAIVPVASLLVIAAGGLAFVALYLAPPEYAVAILLVVIWSRLSDIGVSKYGAPSAAQPLALLVLLLVLVRWRWSRAAPPALLGSLVLFAAQLAVLLASSLVATDVSASGAAVTEFVKSVLVACLLVAVVRAERTFRVVVLALLATGFVIGACNVAQYLTGSFGNDFFGLAQAGESGIVGSTNGFRLGGQMGSPNYFSQTMLVILPLAVERAINAGTRSARWLAGVTALLSVLCVLLSYSRGALVALLVVAGLLLWRWRPPRRVLLTAVLACVLAAPLLPAGYLARTAELLPLVTGQTEQDPSLQGRSEVLGAGLRMLAAHPVLGIGAGNYVVREPAYQGSASLYDSVAAPLAAHNLYLEVAAETGVVGLALLLVILAVTARSIAGAMQAVAARGNHVLADQLWALQVALAGFFAAALFIHAAYPRYMWIVIGLGLASRNLNPCTRRLAGDSVRGSDG